MLQQLRVCALTVADDAALRRDLTETCRAMERLGLTRGTSGNVSVRFGDGLLISPTGIPYDALTPELVVRMDVGGGHAGAVLPSSEWRFHRDILRQRPDVGAVVHTHSTHATAMAVLGLSIPALHYSVAEAGGTDVRCAPYALFGTQELSDAALLALGGRRACLLAHHGVIACGRDLRGALALAVTVEELARLFLLCRSAGPAPVPVLGDAEMRAVLEKYKTYGQQPTQPP